MKIRASVADLQAAVRHMAAAVNATQRVTSHVLLCCRDGICTIEATDYNTHARAVVPCEILADGDSMPPFKALAAWLGQQPPDATVTVAAVRDRNECRVQLECGRGRVSLIASDPTEWPMDAGEIGAGSFTGLDLPPEEFYRLLASVAYARNVKDPSRPALMGVHLTITPSDEGKVQIDARATDGHRLAINREIFDGPAMHAEFTVPSVVIKRLLPLLATAGKLRLEQRQGAVRVTIDGATLTTKPEAEAFPDFTRILADFSAATTIECDRETLLQAIEACKIATGKDLPLVLAVVKGGLRLYASRADECDASAHVAAQVVVHGKAGHVGLSLPQFVAAVKRCGETVQLQLPVDGAILVEVLTPDRPDHVQGMARFALGQPLPDHAIEADDDAA